MSDEDYGHRTHIRVCAECSSNLLIEERTQFKRSQLKSREEDGTPIFNRIWRNFCTYYWCPSCSRSVDTEWSDERNISHSTNDDNGDPMPDGYYHMDSGFHWYHGRLCDNGSFEISGSGAMSDFNQVRSGFIEGFLSAIDNLLARIKDHEREDQERFEASMERNRKELAKLDEQLGKLREG